MITFLTEAEDCDLISRLATDAEKRELFKKRAADFRAFRARYSIARFLEVLQGPR